MGDWGICNRHPTANKAVKRVCVVVHSLGTAVLVILAAWLVTARPAFAGPAAPMVIPVTQPDGSTFNAIPFGDEWSSGYETSEGFTILFDEDSGYWTYAKHDENGGLVKSEGRPALDRPVGITPHLRDRPLPGDGGPARGFDLPDGPMGGAEGATGAIGTRRTLVILVQFLNRPSMGTTPAQWNARFFGTAESLKSYYHEVSYNKLTFAPATETHGAANDGIVGWLTLNYNHPNTRANTNNTTRQLVRDAMIAADPYVNYASYDTNGDGYIGFNELHIIVVPAGYETAYGGPVYACSPSVWMHQWSLGGAYQGVIIEAPRLDGKYVGHGSVGGYAMFGEWHCASTDNPGHMATIGGMCHEMGHQLAWPDLYDIDQSSEGVGYWSVMGSGNWLAAAGGYSGTRPAHPDPFLKWYQGWITPQQIAGSQAGVALPQVETSGRVLQLRDNPGGVDWAFGERSGAGEYFLVENRQKTGYDAGLPGCGLLVWHIDETRVYSNTANTNDARRLLDLEEADGQRHLDTKSNRGDAGDPYPGSSGNRTFNDSSNPNSKLYSGASSGVSVTNISTSCAATMYANIQAPGSVLLPKARLPMIAKGRGGPVTGTPTATRTATRPAAATPTATATPPGSGWTTITSVDFEGTFPGAWRLLDNSGTADGQYYWAKRNCRPAAGLNSGWAVGGGANGAGLACSSSYPNNADSWMWYGPFSLIGASQAELNARLWTNSELNVDGVCLLASKNGSYFYGQCISGSTSNWLDGTLDLASVPVLGNLMGQSQVWVAVVFASNESITLPEGGYVDDIVVRKCAGGSCAGAAQSGDWASGEGYVVEPAMKVAPDQ